MVSVLRIDCVRHLSVFLQHFHILLELGVITTGDEGI